MRILIVEDEEVAAERLKRMLRDLLGGEIDSMKSMETIEPSVFYLEDNPVDLVFLDLDLNGEDGFELFKSAAAGSFHTIIVSANSHLAVQAFEYGVLDFVPKPLNRERLALALERFRKGDGARRTDIRYLSVPQADTLLPVDLDRVAYFQSRDHVVYAFLKTGERLELRKKMATLEALLPENFLRIHKSFIVPVPAIEEILTDGPGKHRVRIGHDTFIPLSRRLFPEVSRLVAESQGDSDNRA